MIEVNTKYTYEIYKQYYWFSLFRGKYYRYGKATFPYLTALMFILTILSFTWLDSLWIKIITTVSIIICIAFYLLAFLMPKRYARHAPSLFQTGQIFIFDEDSFSTMQTGDIASGTGTAKYTAIIKVYEAKEVFYVYISPVQAFLLPKKDFVKGTPEELRALLQSKLPKCKYIVCK